MLRATYDTLIGRPERETGAKVPGTRAAAQRTSATPATAQRMSSTQPPRSECRAPRPSRSECRAPEPPRSECRAKRDVGRFRPTVYGSSRITGEILAESRMTPRAPARARLPLLRFRPGGVGLDGATRGAGVKYTGMILEVVHIAREIGTEIDRPGEFA
jgi:hypothetical protein